MQKKKKGFTLVELLVVIAILAILAGVSVVGYLSFTKKANLSNDQVTIKMVNDNLMGQFVDSKPTSAGDAINKLEDVGFSKDKLVAYSSGHHYAYNLETNMFVLLDENDNVIYPANISANKDDLWGLYLGTTDDNVGLKNYVALDHVNNKDKLYALLEHQTELNIDLNNNYFKIDNYDKDTIINLKNGYSVSSSDNDKVKEDESVIGKKAVKEPENGSISLNENEYKNVIFNNKSTETIRTLNDKTIFDGCVFISDIIPPTQYGNITFNADNPSKTDNPSKNRELVFNNCIFINVGWVQTWNRKLTVTNSEFINCMGGISIKNPTIECVIDNNKFDLVATDVKNRPNNARKLTVTNSEFINCMGGISIKNPTIECVIDNNKFDLVATDVKNRPNNAALMLAPTGFYDAKGNLTETAQKNGFTADDKFTVQFTNNTILNSKSVIRFHNLAYLVFNNDSKTYEPTKDYLTVDTSKFIVSNNKLLFLIIN